MLTRRIRSSVGLKKTANRNSPNRNSYAESYKELCMAVFILWKWIKLRAGCLIGGLSVRPMRMTGRALDRKVIVGCVIFIKSFVLLHLLLQYER